MSNEEAMAFAGIVILGFIVTTIIFFYKDRK